VFEESARAKKKRPWRASDQQRVSLSLPCDIVARSVTMRRSALLLAAAAALQQQAGCSPAPTGQFTTTLSGDGGPPVSVTYINTPGTSTLYEHSLADTDPLAVCNGAPRRSQYPPRGLRLGLSAGRVHPHCVGRRVATVAASSLPGLPTAQRARETHLTPPLPDGSPAAYYMAAAEPGSVDAHRWLVYLEGSMVRSSRRAASACSLLFHCTPNGIVSSSFSPSPALPVLLVRGQL
jgi:hypothetical protein